MKLSVWKGKVRGWARALSRVERLELALGVAPVEGLGQTVVGLLMQRANVTQDERLEATFSVDDALGIGLDLLVVALDAVGVFDHTADHARDPGDRRTWQIATVASYLLACLGKRAGAPRREAEIGIINALDGWLPDEEDGRLHDPKDVLATRALDFVYGPEKTAAAAQHGGKTR